MYKPLPMIEGFNVDGLSGHRRQYAITEGSMVHNGERFVAHILIICAHGLSSELQMDKAEMIALAEALQRAAVRATPQKSIEIEWLTTGVVGEPNPKADAA